MKVKLLNLIQTPVQFFKIFIYFQKSGPNQIIAQTKKCPKAKMSDNANFFIFPRFKIVEQQAFKIDFSIEFQDHFSAHDSSLTGSKQILPCSGPHGFNQKTVYFPTDSFRLRAVWFHPLGFHAKKSNREYYYMISLPPLVLT